MSDQRRFHITNASPATTEVIKKHVFVTQVSTMCSDAGTNWKPSIQSRGSPPMILGLGSTQTLNTTGLANVASFKDDPVFMENGIDILKGSGTPGVIDIWINFRPANP